MEGKGAEDIEMGAGGRRDHVIHAGMATIIYVDCRAFCLEYLNFDYSQSEFFSLAKEWHLYL